MKSSEAIFPLLRYSHTIYSMYLITRSSTIVCSNFKTGSKNYAIDLIFFTFEYYAVFRYFFETFSISINQFNIGIIESLEIFVMKAGTLTELIIVGFQGFGCLFIFHNCISSSSDLFHFLEVSHLHSISQVHSFCNFPSHIRFEADFVHF